MATKEDLEFLALLVHRGHLAREEAEQLFPSLKEGVELDPLLQGRLGWSSDKLAQLRRTRAGEIPEIPGFEMLGKVGTGGTADVFRVRDKKNNRIIALKVLNDASTRHGPTRKAFIDEARLLEKLAHPNLVKGLGVAKSGATYFARMEFIDGHTLLELMDEGQIFDETAALRIVLEMAEVLSYLAAMDVIHRDVKPGNIMLSNDGQLKLIDLGFAGSTEEMPSAVDSTVGTVQYLSPEQARGGAAADMRSDIYSLGVTLFHLVIGRLPFESSDDREVLRMQVMESLSSPELKSRGLSHYVHYFIEKMMAKELEERYQSYMELSEDIRGQIEGRDSLDYAKQARAKGGSKGARRH